jgi:predicted lipid-binding transport protein (Tim44 family)
MSFPVLDILLLAVVAGFIVFRLRSVLGRRTGDERPRQPPFRHGEAGDRLERSGNVVRLPGSRPNDDAARASAKATDDGNASPVARGLTQVQLADRRFDPEKFLAGARAAYEMIVMAFARGDRKTLRPLLSDEVYDSFDAALKTRETNGLTAETQFVGLDRADIVAATLKERIAEITVKFISEIISVTRNRDGAVVDGDPSTVRRVTDIWTFARDTRSGDPNWKLVGTAAGA